MNKKQYEYQPKALDKIRETLIYTFYIREHGMGDTAQDMSNWQQRALLKYKSDIKFQALIQRLMYIIADEFDTLLNMTDPPG